MATTRERRVAKELQDIWNDRETSGVMAEPLNSSNLSHLKGTFSGPPDSPYAGGTYEVDIQIPDKYPFKPPAMCLITKIWHPNISSVTGAICLDILGTAWSPVGTIKTALLAVRMLLESPNPKDPQDAQVAKMLIENPKLFARTAHDWAVKYAGAPRVEAIPLKYDESSKEGSRNDATRYAGYNKDLVDRFVNMGFDVDKVVEAFLFVGIDRNGGNDYELEEAYMGDITARLLGEQ
ncbi:ubiquitin-conjugating enzyme/RWD-like protein [Copromyces sp. CBS 386.78]|uniref:Ubiquitin-conjugating enzyme E2 1 n=1 Tax=Pseudoneurospora amorphoporcata TaxID=241081 RepID=A0AAN6NKR1_9PEZI|nr:ubiquitin-conjugating enzyme/RWD-like protein [Copromyces sp. CBS 386.78]KAK3947665.1 ubiquitin-conjugating enzyme/RWD-like protein [Pseudoneurospora amorphoporcata]